MNAADEPEIMAKARELLAQAYEELIDEGPYLTYAATARTGNGSFTMCSVRAIARVLTSDHAYAEGLERSIANLQVDLSFYKGIADSRRPSSEMKYPCKRAPSAWDDHGRVVGTVPACVELAQTEDRSHEIANEIRIALDKESCPVFYMNLAYEAAVSAIKGKP